MRLMTGSLRGVGRAAALLAIAWLPSLAMPARALAQQPEPAGAAAAQAERTAGGEANLVLPDLAQVDVGGYDGRDAADGRDGRRGARASSSAW